MKDPFERTKVVLRHLPPAISQSVLMEQIDNKFAGRYRWFCFLPGKNSQKNQRFSRAYIDFEKPEDVVEFAEFFDGHVFVNEKGTQFKTLVEYAPSQRVPKLSKKDGREGTIIKDPEYLEFLEHVAKPAENLPSAEIQLERREAERAGTAKEMIIVTPLMEFVRQKRAAKSGSQKLSANGKNSRRAGVVSSSPLSSKRGSEKRRVSTPIYVLRDSTKSGIGKEKSTSILLPKREDQQDKAVTALASRAEALEDETGTGLLTGCAGAVEAGKKKLVLLKGKERGISNGPGDTSQQQAATSPARSSSASTAFKHSQRHGASGKLIRSILSKEARQSQSHPATYKSEQQTQISNLEKDKRPPRPPNLRMASKDHIASYSLHAAPPDNDVRVLSDDKVGTNDLHGAVPTGERHDRRSRKKERLDRVWTPLRRPDGSNASDDSLSSSSSLTTSALSEFVEGMSISAQVAGANKSYDDDSGNQCSHSGISTGSPPVHDTLSSHMEMKNEVHSAGRSGEGRGLGSGRGRLSVMENSSHRHVGRRGPSHGSREADALLNYPEAKTSKRGPAGYGSHEKQIWVQKTGSGS